MDLNQNDPGALLDATRNSLLAEVAAHPFHVRFRAGLTHGQMCRFAVQWHITARLHKAAFPAVILNTHDDDIRFDLIEILREEYGSGERDKIHSRSLARFLGSLGLDAQRVTDADAILPVKHFGDQVLGIWRDAVPARAFGLHFGLETIASFLHDTFATGVAESRLPVNNEYFEMHRTAEQAHADISLDGFLKYAAANDDRSQLLRGVDDSRKLLRTLLDGLTVHVFGSDVTRAA